MPISLSATVSLSKSTWKWKMNRDGSQTPSARHPLPPLQDSGSHVGRRSEGEDSRWPKNGSKGTKGYGSQTPRQDSGSHEAPTHVGVPVSRDRGEDSRWPKNDGSREATKQRGRQTLAGCPPPHCSPLPPLGGRESRTGVMTNSGVRCEHAVRPCVGRKQTCSPISSDLRLRRAPSPHNGLRFPRPPRLSNASSSPCWWSVASWCCCIGSRCCWCW